MKLLSYSILLSSLFFTFNYVWINRITVIEQSDLHSVLMNKWTGNHCVFYSDKDNREYANDEASKQSLISLNVKPCFVTENGKINLP